MTNLSLSRDHSTTKNLSTASGAQNTDMGEIEFPEFEHDDDRRRTLASLTTSIATWELLHTLNVTNANNALKELKRRRSNGELDVDDNFQFPSVKTIKRWLNGQPYKQWNTVRPLFSAFPSVLALHRSFLWEVLINSQMQPDTLYAMMRKLPTPICRKLLNHDPARNGYFKLLPPSKYNIRSLTVTASMDNLSAVLIILNESHHFQLAQLNQRSVTAAISLAARLCVVTPFANRSEEFLNYLGRYLSDHANKIYFEKEHQNFASLLLHKRNEYERLLRNAQSIHLIDESITKQKRFIDLIELYGIKSMTNALREALGAPKVGANRKYRSNQILRKVVTQISLVLD